MNDPRLHELAAVISVLTQHRVLLHDLDGFEPVGALAESIRSTLAGSGSLDRRELERIQVWSSRWLSICPEVRRFYRIAVREVGPDHVDRARLEHAVWLLIEPATDQWVPRVGIRRDLDRLFYYLIGFPPGTDLLPLLPHSSETSR